MLEQLKDKMYDFFIKNSDRSYQDDLHSVFKGIGHYVKDKEPGDILKEYMYRSLHKNQLIYIRKLAERFGDKIIFVKGIVASWELYGDIDQRRSSDIDIIVKAPDIREIGKYLLEEGFCCGVRQEEWDNDIKKGHLSFAKPLLGKMELVVEIHEDAINPPGFFEGITEHFWEHAQVREIMDMQLQLLDPYDTVIYYMLHYYKHSDNFEYYALQDVRTALLLQGILDVYCMVKKFNLSFTELQTRMEQMCVLPECVEVLRLVAKIFPEFRSSGVMDNLQSIAAGLGKRSNLFWRNRIKNRRI